MRIKVQQGETVLEVDDFVEKLRPDQERAQD
jgi:hypothetical protein